jgi:predicted ester cyclase
MSIEHNKQLVLRWKDEFWRKRNVHIVDELYAPDYVGHIAGTPGPVRGREALNHLLAGYFAAFDGQFPSELVLAEGDLVAIYDKFRLKYTGPFQGISPTGKEAIFTSIDIYRMVDGKVMEQWTEADLLGLLQQLGVVPAPGHEGR